MGAIVPWSAGEIARWIRADTILHQRVCAGCMRVLRTDSPIQPFICWDCSRTHGSDLTHHEGMTRTEALQRLGLNEGQTIAELLKGA